MYFAGGTVLGYLTVYSLIVAGKLFVYFLKHGPGRDYASAGDTAGLLILVEE